MSLTIIAVVVWILAGFALCIGGVFAVPFVGLLNSLAWFGSGLLLFGINAWQARRRERRPLRVVAALAILVSGGVIFGRDSSLVELGDHLRFAISRPKYLEIVRRVEAGQAQSGEQSYLGITYEVDPGPPTRVAFPLPNGLVDNWCAVIFDKTGSLRATNASMTSIFGGDLVGCRAIEENFFECCFT
jgi:hypothetical protein